MPHTLPSVPSGETPPDSFTHAVASLRSMQPRPEISLIETTAPRRLAPHAFALAASVLGEVDQAASGKLILLYDPNGQTNWHGVMRIVTYVEAELESEIVRDPLFADVGWAWLTDSLQENGAHYTAVAGTVTQIISTRFGELAEPQKHNDNSKTLDHKKELVELADPHTGSLNEPVHTTDIELRASWTPLDEDLGPHLDAWCTLLASTAGLPPIGVSSLPNRRH